MSEPDHPTGGKDEGYDDDIGAKMTGVAPAKVTDNEDKDKLGRVKVSYPWRDADDESYWARIASPLTGKKYGSWFLPEVDDEVLVAFERGNIHEPYVVGMLWTGKAKPPKDNSDGKNKFRTIVSRKGHKVEFNDSKKKAKITVETNGGRKMIMKDKSGKEAIKLDDGKNTIEMKKSKGGKIKIDAGKEIKLSAKKIKLEGKSEVSAKAKGKVKLKGKGKVDIQSKGQLNLKSSGLGKLKASGPLQVKGAIVQIN